MISDNRENRRRSSLTTESSPRKDVDMTQNELAERLRDMSDALNICGADYSDVLLDAARELDRRSWIPQPTLTDEERQVIFRAMYRVVGADSAILCSLLERTK
jgi:hypothetical protein